MTRHSLAALGLAGLLVTFLGGCGGTAPSAPQADAKPAAANPPAASIGGLAPTPVTDEDLKEAEDDRVLADLIEKEAAPGTPEWLLREAMRVRLGKPADGADLAEQRAFRKKQNEQIADLAQQAIALTHSDKALERQFDAAVHQLLEARLQLALSGEAAAIDALYEDAQALLARDPKSNAAAEASRTLVNLAYAHARVAKPGDARWLEEFVTQAISYAVTFPQDERHAVPLVFTAGRSCEAHGKTELAEKCYTLLQRAFPKSPYSARASAVLRRMRLPGSATQIAGDTLDGKAIALDDLLGQVVVVVFWSTEAKPFAEQLPRLQSMLRKHGPQGVTVIGVPLDTTPGPVHQFVVKNHLNWPQLFAKKPEERGWNSRIVSFYGLQEVPAYWLVDHNGTVVSTSLDIDQLEPAIVKVLSQKPPTAARTADRTATTVK